MAGVLPEGGVAPAQTRNALDNPSLAAGCNNLWYPARCNPRLDPAAMNAIQAEIINLVNCAGLPYDCNKLDNLCTAVKDLINDVLLDNQIIKDIVKDVLHDCLQDRPFPDSTGACSVSQVVFATDATGCQRFATFTQESSALGIAFESSVFGNAFPITPWPETPDDEDTYYNFQDLKADANSDTVNGDKLSRTRLVELKFNITCNDTLVEVFGKSDSIDVKPGLGLSRLGVRVDGKFPLAGTEMTSIGGKMTNFEGSSDVTFSIPLNAGPHVLEMYIIADLPGTPPAQVFVSGIPIGGLNSLRAQIKLK